MDLIPTAVTAVVLVVMLIGLSALLRAAQRKSNDQLTHARWEPVAHGPDHTALGPIVDDLVAAGYVVDSAATLPGVPRPIAVVALVHPDGTLALAMRIRSLGGAARHIASIESMLLPGERELTTLSGGAIAARPEDLVEVAGRRPDVARLRQRHLASRAWLEQQGVVAVPVVLGQAGPVIEAGLDAAARRRATVGASALIWRQTTGGGRFRRPLPERPEVRPTIEAIRAQQQQQGIAR